MKLLQGKAAIVTGGTRGIGKAIAHMLLEQGADVMICGRGEETTSASVMELAHKTGGKVRGKAADVSDDEQVSKLFQFADKEFGRLDILINNAGIGVFRSMPELSVEEWKRTMET